MSQEIVQRTPQQQLIARVRGEDFMQQVALALPETVRPERFVRATVTALMQTPDLAEADPASIFTAAIRAAQDGLIPDGREAAFVIFKGKAVYMPMIGGFRKIAAEHGWAIRTEVVYEHDEFEHEEGLDPVLRHRPARLSASRGQPIAAYAVAVHRDGRKLAEVLTAEEIEKVRQTSRAKDTGPWKEWPDRMWEKTAGRRLFAKLPLAEEDKRVQRMLAASDEIDPAAAARMIYGPDRPASSPPPALPPSTGGGEAQQAETAAAATPPGDQAAASVPGPDFANEPKLETKFDPPAAIADAVKAAATAGETRVQGGQYDGKTLREISEQGADGERWLLWALKEWGQDDFRRQLELFVPAYAPDVWEQYVQPGQQELPT